MRINRSLVNIQGANLYNRHPIGEVACLLYRVPIKKYIRYATESEMGMSINIKTSGAHHIALRSTNLERSKRFYTETLGFSIIKETPELFLFSAGNTAFGVRGPATDTVSGDKFNPHRVGLDHIALACEDETELERVAAALTEAGVENTGVKLDETLGKRYVAFKDPDRIAWEFYMA